jgi:hypothetical protein
MSLNKFTNLQIGKDIGLKIGAEEIECETLIVNNSIIVPAIDDLTVNNLSVTNNLTVKTVNNQDLSLKTPTLGNFGDVLKTDGIGNVFFGSSAPIGSGIVYSGSLPIPTGQHVKISTDGTTVFQSVVNETLTNLDIGGLNLTDCNDISCTSISTVSGTLNFNTTGNIQINGNKSLLTDKTVFTQDQELVTKKYVDDKPPSNPFNQSLNTTDNVIFNSVGCDNLYSYNLYPQSLNDLNIGTSNTDILRLGGDGVFINGGSLVGLNDVISTRISADLLYPKVSTTSFIDLSVDENIKVNTSNFLLNGTQIATIADIPAPQTFQDIYDNSPAPVNINVEEGKPIFFNDDETLPLSSVMEISRLNVSIPALKTAYIQKSNALSENIIVELVGLTANNFKKDGGTASQYLMADGSTTAISAIGSNIYLYSFSDITTTPPPNGRLRFDNNTLLSSVSNVYISHITDNNIDIDPFFISIQTNNILYIQHTTTSTEWIKFTITATPTITPEDFISIPVSLLGNGTFNPPSNIFLNNTNIYFSIFSSTETTNPFNQSLNTTDNVVFNTITKSGGLSNQYLMADGSITNTDNLNSVIAKTQYIDVSIPNTMQINVGTLAVRSLVDLLAGAPFNLLPNVSIVNITPPIATSSISLSTPITDLSANTQATTKLYVDNKVGAITLTTTGTGAPILNDNTNPSFSIRSLKSTAGNDRIDIAIGGVGGSEITLTNPSPASSTTITSTDNNLLTITGTSPNFSITPKYTYMLTFGGNNNGTTSQWLQYGTLRTATISNTNAPTHQAIIPIASTLVWASIIRTTTTGTCSLAYSISGGTAVIITPILTAGQASNPSPYALNSIIPANGNLGVSVLSSVLSGNCLVSFLLRSN